MQIWFLASRLPSSKITSKVNLFHHAVNQNSDVADSGDMVFAYNWPYKDNYCIVEVVVVIIIIY